MNKLIELKKKLESVGYSVYFSEIKGVNYLRGGISSENNLETLRVEIWVHNVGEQFVFKNIDAQVSEDVYFNSTDELFEFIQRKYSS